MIEKITVKNILVAEFVVFDEITYRFEKYIEGGQVRVFEDNEEINVFVNYEIKDNLDRFEASCTEWLKERFEG